MSISIITINYNNKYGLFKTIESVFPVHDKIIEQVVIDAKSSDLDDNDWSSIKSRNISFISERDNGVYDGMNKGAVLTKGDYLFFLNSGDYLIKNDSLDSFSEFIGKYDLIFANVLKVKNGLAEEMKYPDELSLEYMLIYGLPHQGTLIRREIHDQIGGYQVGYKIISDWVFFMEALFFHNASYRHVDEIVSVFDGHGMSQNNKNLLLIISEQLDYISKRFPDYIDFYKRNSPYVKKYFRGIPRWKRWWKKFIFMNFNRI